jgi:hypothetical protein
MEIVMAGLVPAISLMEALRLAKRVAQHKAGHDGESAHYCAGGFIGGLPADRPMPSGAQRT